MKRENDTKIKWLRPDNHLGYINDNDENRGIGKDIYNKEYWILEMLGDDEQWIFTINEPDLKLF